jgi:hypothetical protein
LHGSAICAITGDMSQAQNPEDRFPCEPDVMEDRLVEGDPVRIYSASGTLLREYPDFYETVVPDSDCREIRRQIMIQWRETDIAFTKRDLQFAARYDLSEARIIGRTYLFSMKPKDKGWPCPDILGRRYDELMTQPDLVTLLKKIRKSPVLLEYSWDPEVDLLQVRNDAICSGIADSFSLDYRKTLYTGCFNPPRKLHPPFV